MVVFLLRSGANPNICQISSEHPLILLAESNCLQAMKLLAKAGARFSDTNNLLANYLELSNTKIPEEDIFGCSRILISAGADVNMPWGPRLMTPLMLAFRYGHSRIAQYLISNNADINAKDANGKAISFYAKLIC